MSVSKPWKDQERRHAKRMGGVRIWRQDFSEVAPDGETDTDTWDSKRLARLKGLVESFYEHKKKYAEYTGHRDFHMLLNYSGSRRKDLVLVDADHYAVLVKSEKARSEMPCFCGTANAFRCPRHVNPVR